MFWRSQSLQLVDISVFRHTQGFFFQWIKLRIGWGDRSSSERVVPMLIAHRKFNECSLHQVHILWKYRFTLIMKNYWSAICQVFCFTLWHGLHVSQLLDQHSTSDLLLRNTSRTNPDFSFVSRCTNLHFWDSAGRMWNHVRLYLYLYLFLWSWGLDLLVNRKQEVSAAFMMQIP